MDSVLERLIKIHPNIGHKITVGTKIHHSVGNELQLVSLPAECDTYSSIFIKLWPVAFQLLLWDVCFNSSLPLAAH